MRLLRGCRPTTSSGSLATTPSEEGLFVIKTRYFLYPSSLTTLLIPSSSNYSRLEASRNKLCVLSNNVERSRGSGLSTYSTIWTWQTIQPARPSMLPISDPRHQLFSILERAPAMTWGRFGMLQIRCAVYDFHPNISA